MQNALSQINYLAVFVTTIAGFLLGWLWYSPVLFVKPWMAEMKLTEESMKECAQKGMAGFFIRGFIYTLLSTLALTVLILSRGNPNFVKGAGIGAFVGLLLVGTRMLNGAVWEQKSAKLMAIVVGHEVALFTLQGAILGAWA
jgi:hypothetical protein